MSFAFSLHDRSVADGVRRIAAEQIAKAIEQAADVDHAPAKRIHDVRKRCKKLRGLLRLVTPALAGFARENARISAAAAGLATARDARVMLDTLAALNKKTRKSLRFAIPESPPPENTEAEEEAALLKFRTAMTPVLTHAGRWALDGDGFGLIGPGLTRTYRDARRARRNAQRSGSAVAFHEWRKLVKYHWHHLSLLRECTPAAQRSQIDAAEHLSDLLGLHHDLAVLAATLADDPNALGIVLDVDKVQAAARKRQDALARQAFALAKQVLAEKPKALRRRFEAYWTAWQAGEMAVATTPGE